MSWDVAQGIRQRVAARTELEAALARLTQLGEQLYAERVEQALAALDRKWGKQ